MIKHTLIRNASDAAAKTQI